MRLMWEIFTVLAGIGVIFALGKGFPGFGRVLAFFLVNPYGLLCLVGLFVWIVVIRKRTAAQRAQGDVE